MPRLLRRCIGDTLDCWRDPSDCCLCAVVREVLAGKASKPVRCLAGARLAPTEDLLRRRGDAGLQEALADPDPPDYADLRE